MVNVNFFLLPRHIDIILHKYVKYLTDAKESNKRKHVESLNSKFIYFVHAEIFKT